MGIIYKDIDLLTQKSAVAGTEKIPVSDTEYITPEQMLSNISAQLSALTTQVNLLASREQFPQNYREALLACFDDVDWSSAEKETLMAALEEAMTDHGDLLGIEATYTQTATITTVDSLDKLKSDLVVVAEYEDGFEKEVDDYTLSGTLTSGTSTVTVTYEGETDTIQVTVVYKYLFKLSDGDVEKVNGATSWDDTHGAYMNTGTISVGRRRSFPVISGERSFRTTTDNETYTDTSIYYPIPIPSDATSVQISITPSTQYFGPAFYTLANGEYTRQLDPGWKQGSNTYQMTAGQYSYLSITSKYNSGGTSYPTEPSELVITFNK